MSKKLFDKLAWSWKKEQYALPFNSLDEAPKAEASKFMTGTGKTAGESRLSAQVLRALQRIFLMCCIENVGGYLKTTDADERYLVEIPHIKGKTMQAIFESELIYPVETDGYTQVYYVAGKGKFLAAQIDAEGNRTELKPEQSITAFFAAALIHAIETDDEAQRMWDIFSEEQFNAAVPALPSKTDELFSAACILSDNLYRRVNYFDEVEDKFPGKGIRVNLDNVGFLKESHLVGITAEHGKGYISGIGEVEEEAPRPSAPVKKTETEKKRKRPSSVQELKGFYKLFEDRLLTPEEEALVPEIPESYQITEQMYEVLDLIKESTNLPTPVRNFIFLGEAGSGKTEFVKMVANALNQPLVHQPCGVDTDKFDIAQQVIPDGSGGFKYVKGPLMQACEKGYVCEISEADLILKQGTLGEFNPLLDKTGTYPLPTGEIVKRHPDTVLIFTMNGNYEGCRNLNQAVRNRCMVFHFDTPSDEVLIERVKTESGYEDTDVLSKMVDVYHRIREFCDTNSVTDGVCGIRNLIQWATMTAINGRPWHNAYSCMVLGATFDTEVHEELMRCVETQFVPEEVKLP